jgi:hypothetical protein
MVEFLERVRSSSAALKWTSIALICVLAAVTVALLSPIPQSLSYHHFADSGRLLGLPNALDVLSNLSFLLVGLLGFTFTLHSRSALEQPQRWAYAVLFAGLFLTAIGSGYYHLAPDNHRLVADRLPMTIAMAGFIAVLLCDRFGGRTLWSLPLLLLVGIGSVVQWNISEQQGHGDLRWYALYQGLVMIFGTAVLLLFPSRKDNTRAFAIAVIGNIAAKIFELLDKPIFALGGIVSGHTLKHLSAGLSFVPLVFFLYSLIPKERNQAARGKSA